MNMRMASYDGFECQIAKHRLAFVQESLLLKIKEMRSIQYFAPRYNSTALSIQFGVMLRQSFHSKFDIIA